MLRTLNDSNFFSFFNFNNSVVRYIRQYYILKDSKIEFVYGVSDHS